MKINWKLCLLTLGLILSVGSFAASNKLLKIGISQEFENLNPLIKQMLATTYIYEMVGRNLVVLDKDGKWVPKIVEKIPSLEDGTAKLFTDKKGNKKIRADWKIKESAKWGDGTPVTGHDVKFAWEVSLSPNVSVGEKEVYSQVEEIIVDSKDPKKFTFIYEKAKWDFYQLGTFEIVPKHLEEPIFKKYKNEKEGYGKNSLYTTDPTNPGLYNGPYRVSEIKLGSHVTLVPNKYFYGDQPKIEKIVLKLIPNTGTLESNIRAGNIDMISVLGFTLDQALAFEKRVKSNKLPFSTNFKQGLIYEHIDLQLKNPFLKDLQVRKALVYAIDREKLTKALFEGRQTPAIHNVAPIDPWYTKDPKKIVLYKYSKRKAEKLLDQAGWKKAADRFRYKNGQKLSFTFMTTAGNNLREKVQVFLQNEWKKIGVDVSIKNEPPRVYFGETVRKGKYDAMAMFAWISSPENTPRSTFHTKSIPSSSNGFSGQNSGGWSNQKVDKLLEMIDEEFDFKKRQSLAQQVLYHYTNEVPVIPLYYRSDISVTPNGLKGYFLTGHQFTPGNHVENWHF